MEFYMGSATLTTSFTFYILNSVSPYRQGECHNKRRPFPF